ncbi:ribosome maturation factor RimP [Candidatus Omnitrophota bacterium]
MLDKIKEVIKPVLEEENTELVDMVYRREAGRQVLRLLVDKEGGVNLADCVRLNERISQIIDEGDVITESYVIEVDSPGIDRPFKIKRDYERAKGRMVRVTLSEAILDKKEYIGRLGEIGDDFIKVDTEKKGIIDIPFIKVVRARQEVEF